MAPAAASKKPRASTDKPYRRGVTLGKAMRRGKLDKGGAAGGGPQQDGKATRTSAAGAKGKGKVRAPAPRAADEPQSDEGDVEQLGGEEDGEGARGAAGLEGDSEDDEPASEPSQAATNKRRVPRKAGGTGKKHKVFVEEKSDLLSLAASIGGQAEAKKQERLEKAKNKPVAPVKKAGKEPSEAKQKQLAAARAIVAARSKANKESKKAAAAPKPAAPAPVEGGRKKVSFA
ncbi:hypothetical protein JCM3775_002603 [Rhodotorula graminis]|uniref:Uncharacterized protein n=1 Tax=Rhodotorula graminis (strain WP1) TaxID=578459 RepID=A0A194S6B7_RHOGW|nr:uncharacterized protein RHOBADRAFT_43527 [Rhodotorula graminis WP1]KPV76089.1 hypothetical protein RHOBADRAFT_43527 [Rhodotorula graminis WP1]